MGVILFSTRIRARTQSPEGSTLNCDTIDKDPIRFIIVYARRSDIPVDNPSSYHVGGTSMPTRNHSGNSPSIGASLLTVILMYVDMEKLDVLSWPLCSIPQPYPSGI